MYLKTNFYLNYLKWINQKIPNCNFDVKLNCVQHFPLNILLSMTHYKAVYLTAVCLPIKSNWTAFKNENLKLTVWEKTLTNRPCSLNTPSINKILISIRVRPYSLHLTVLIYLFKSLLFDVAWHIRCRYNTYNASSIYYFILFFGKILIYKDLKYLKYLIK